MRIERRRFLQQTGLALVTLGASQIGFSRLNRYVETLAEPTSRKLALLIGINKYQDYPHLNGCLRDVELQRDLLIHRFNFQPADILTLTETQATRENIETAFVEHLIKQANSGDVVVFHFSGYGTLVKIPSIKSIGEVDSPIASLVPVDHSLPSKNPTPTNNLLEQTLVVLAQSLSTDRITCVLDTSYHSSPKSLQGNLRVRSLPQLSGQKSSTSELAFQEHLQLSSKKNLQQIFLKAGTQGQLALEENWQGFSAGLFTYCLTQYLWEKIPPISIMTSLRETTATMTDLVGIPVKPEVSTQGLPPALPYYLSPTQALGAQGYIKAIIDNDVQVKLLGLPPRILQNYRVNSCLSVAALEPPQYLQIRSQDGIKFSTHLLGEHVSPGKVLQVGQLVKEYIRLLSRETKLIVALDSSLERIERVDATSALAGVEFVSTVATAGEQWADSLLGKTKTGYGLFTPGGTLIPQTTGEANEAIKSAISRLTPDLKTILATKLWSLTLNQGSSQLPVEATITLFNQKRQKFWQQSTRSGVKSDLINTSPELLPSVAAGSLLEYRITNLGNNPIYFLLLGILPNNRAIAFISPLSTEEESPGFIKPGQVKVFPWSIVEPLGVNQILLICSQNPWRRTMSVLSSNQQTLGNKEQILPLANPLAVAQEVLSDLHSTDAAELTAASSDVYALAVSNWATLRFVYAVVK
ncbi:caspase family protein [Gloeocapsa sp. PCC 73106]|uniref:caspase family protein n=1 Tax=Gloeocapsa sp. PCC 73106 TaxID=102232 RepID=UPI0002ACC4EB|nr:caspase family protein [Gloeocapsa sp. PCC 73106]ELR96614.1 Caspase domain-containing protein [Gloeocapsa sp. PCC 73106]